MKLTWNGAVDYIEGLAANYGPTAKFTANIVEIDVLEGKPVAYVTFDDEVGHTEVATVWVEGDHLYGEW